MVRDESDNVENKTMQAYYLDEDDMYPLQNYNGQPEFSIFERERYNLQEEEVEPVLTFSTTIAKDELSPMPNDHTLEF